MSEFVGYATQSYWGARREEPAELGRRYWKMLQLLGGVNRAFGDWKFIGLTKLWPMPLEPGTELTHLISDCVDTADDGEPTPINGYRFGAGTWTGSKSSLIINVHAGCYAPNMQFYTNTVGLKTQPLSEENIGMITAPIFKAALLAIAAAWDATWCGAYPWDIIPLWPDPVVEGRPTLRMAWITYLSPRFAPLVTPPRSAIVEHTPQGGIVMTATEERFDVTNPAHLAAAREIEAALAPVNALPWPPDEP